MDGDSVAMGDRVMDEKEDGEEVKAWDKFYQKAPAEVGEDEVPGGYSLLFDGRQMGDGLEAAAAELVSDLLWGNLALPINKCLEKLQRLEAILRDGAPADEEYLGTMTSRIDIGVAKAVTDIPPPRAAR